MSPATAYVALGSNLSHPRRQIAQALARLARIPRTRLVRASRNYLTAPVGTSMPQPDYVNAVAQIETELTPRALLARLHAIERRHGRQRVEGAQRNAPRALDLDLLMYGRRTLSSRMLILPHPRMHERAFVLRPLVDVAPTIAIPHRGLARRLLRSVQSQRIARTRAHRRPG